MIYGKWSSAEEREFASMVRFLKERPGRHYMRVGIKTSDKRAGELSFLGNDSGEYGDFILNRNVDHKEELVVYIRYHDRQFFLIGSVDFYNQTIGASKCWQEADGGFTLSALKSMLDHLRYTAKMVNLLVNRERFKLLQTVGSLVYEEAQTTLSDGSRLADKYPFLEKTEALLDKAHFDGFGSYNDNTRGSWLEQEMRR